MEAPAMRLHAALLARCRCLLKIQKYLVILLFGDTRLSKLKFSSRMSLIVAGHVCQCYVSAIFVI